MGLITRAWINIIDNKVKSTSCKGRDEQIHDNTAMCYRRGTSKNLVEKPLAKAQVVREEMSKYKITLQYVIEKERKRTWWKNLS